MNKNELEVSDIKVFETSDGKSGTPVLLFRAADMKFVTALNYDPVLLYDFDWDSVYESIKTLLYNRIPFEQKLYSSGAEIHEFIESRTPRLSPQDKLDRVLELISNKAAFDGQKVLLDGAKEIEEDELWRRFYFVNAEEFYFYLENLIDDGYLSADRGKNRWYNLSLKLKGLSKILRITESKNSKIAFVAMSFDQTLVPIFENAIRAAIIETGFEPLIIREQHFGADVTINDEIIAGLKRAKFTIADFTLHRAGVYFEAGYALGRGQKVIYSCRETDMKDAHFDTRNYQHITWTDASDFKKKLVDKIDAFIKE